MNVLIIDDDSELRLFLRDALAEKVDWEVEAHGFERVNETLARCRPDMMVLDIVQGEALGEDGQDTGNTWFEQIRARWFCPVVVYSAFVDRWGFDQQPFVKKVTKGDGTEEKVHARLKAFASTAEMIRTVHHDFDARVREALCDSVHALRSQLEAGEAGSSEDSNLARAVRRVVAARVDTGASGESKLHPWERYVIPPLGQHLLTADLLRRADADWSQADAFRLVLTPSCDLVQHGGGSANVEQILVARCEPLERLGTIQLEPGNLKNKQKDKLRTHLAEGMVGNHMPIPGFRGHVPLMAADLRNLELLSWDQVEMESGSDHCPANEGVFRRIASTDSPFREMVGWAYLRVTGRPGTPEIDVERWLEEISDHLKTDAGS